MDAFTIKTNNKEELIDITNEVEKIANGKNGICFIFVKHATAALYINENESGLKMDFSELLSTLVPEKNWKHNRADDNAAAHLKASLIGQSGFIPVSNGKLQLGKWQTLFLVEFDGPRERELIIDVR